MILHTNIHILRPLEDLDYFDERSTVLPAPISPLMAWNLGMSRPQPFLRAAFWIRDAISSRFGVEKISGFSGEVRQSVKAGDHLDFFLVELVAPDALVLTVRDRHLDVMTCISTSDCTLTITSSVKTHNAFGRAYMVPVGLAHKVIVTNTLRRVKRQVRKQMRKEERQIQG